MERRELGRSGISVTRIVLGCGNFGGVGSAPALFGQGISHEEAFADHGCRLGARDHDVRHRGRLRRRAQREPGSASGSRRRAPLSSDAITIETKTFNPMDAGEDRGLSRQRIARQLETSLERLGVERVALYMAHAPDPETPVEETMSAFDALVRAGKVGAVGASNFTAEQLAESVEISELEGLTRYEWVQNSFSLLDAERRRDGLPRLSRARARIRGAQRPLAGGWLAGRYRRGASYPEGSRMTQRPEGYRQVRVGDDLRRARGVRGRGARARGVDGRPRDRVAPRRARADRGRRSGRRAPSSSSRWARRSRSTSRRRRARPSARVVRVIVLSEHDVRELLDMQSCIEAMEEVLASLARGELYNPLRSIARPRRRRHAARPHARPTAAARRPRTGSRRS